MTVGNSDGQKRCDEKCYNATGGNCSCCCGGTNHGVGLKQAVDNTEQYGKELLENIKKKHPELKTTIENIQESLFNE
jgi:alpha-galactosidase/6-phospho-beta-glucosidase family protein